MKSAIPTWLFSVMRFVREHLRERLSLGMIADVAGVHPSHLARVFHRCTGTTVRTYIKRLRIEAAMAALKEKRKPVVEIALDLGFYDQSHFHHAFKAYTGMTPVAFGKAGSGCDLRRERAQSIAVVHRRRCG